MNERNFSERHDLNAAKVCENVAAACSCACRSCRHIKGLSFSQVCFLLFLSVMYSLEAISEVLDSGVSSEADSLMQGFHFPLFASNRSLKSCQVCMSQNGSTALFIVDY